MFVPTFSLFLEAALVVIAAPSPLATLSGTTRIFVHGDSKLLQFLAAVRLPTHSIKLDLLHIDSTSTVDSSGFNVTLFL